MPTLPLFNPDARPDAWHQVRAPGGYECWRFEADDVESDRQVIVEFWYGDVLNPKYRDEYARYVRQPTRIAPPQPQEFIAVRAIVFHHGTIESELEERISPVHFAAQTDRADVQLGSNRLVVEDGALRVSAQSLRLNFQPRKLMQSEVPLPPTLSGTHRWLLPYPLCDVSGEMRIDCQSINFRGRGCHDHLFGDRPPHASAQRWLRGRVLTTEAFMAFQFIQPDASSIVEITPTVSVSHRNETVEMNWTTLSARVGKVLTLLPPRKVEIPRGITRLMYEAELHGKPARATAELI